MQSKSRNRHFLLLFFSVLLICLIPVAILSYEAIRAALGDGIVTPVAHWKFDELTDNTCSGGSNDACDFVGDSDAANSNAIWKTSDECINGGCLFFNGSSGNLSIGDNATLSLTGSFTLMGWIKPLSSSGEYTIAGRWAHSLEEYVFTLVEDEIRLWLNGDNYQTTTNANLQTGQWYHVAASYNASGPTIKLYVNGILTPSTTTGTIPGSLTDENNTFTFGGPILSSGTEYQVGANTDDGYDESDSSTLNDGTNIRLGGVDEADNNITAGFRFTNVAIAQGATISSADLDFNEDWGGNYSTFTRVKIYGEDSDDCVTFSNGSLPRSRTKTTAALDWDSNGSQGSVGQWYQTSATVPPPDIATIIQEIVDRPGWTSGNDICIVMDDDGSTTDWYMVGESYNETPSEAAKLTIGVAGSGVNTSRFHGYMDDFQLFNQVLTDGEVKSFAVPGSSKQAAFVAGNENDPSLFTGLVGYWPMDDDDIDSHSCSTGGTGDTCDTSGNNNHGTDVGTMTDSDYEGGKFGSSLDFDGSNDAISITDTASLKPNNGSWSLAVWANPANANQDNALISKSAGGGTYEEYSLQICGDTSCGSSGQFLVANLNEDVGTVYRQCASTTDVADGNWHHYAAVFDKESDAIKLFMDGQELATTCNNEGVWPTVDNTTNLTLGAYNDSGLQKFFTGNLEEVRIYNRSLSPAEIKALYDWAPAPTLYWKFDEGGSAQTAFDSSGNSLNGTLGNGTGSDSFDPVWEVGQFGSSLRFDGASSGVEILDSNLMDVGDTNKFTIAAWVRRRGNAAFNNPMIIANKVNRGGNVAGYQFIAASDTGTCGMSGTSSNRLCLFVDDGTDEYAFYTASGTLTADSLWHHVAVVWDGETESNNRIYLDGVAQTLTTSGTFANIGSLANSNGFCVGEPSVPGGCSNGSGNVFNGNIDDVKFYNYARSQQQIVEDMNGGHPTGGSPIGTALSHWQFDECAGTTGYDRNTSKSNTLTLSTASWTTNGKFGCAFNGDGSTYLSRADDADFDFSATDDFSISLWFKSDSATNPATTEFLFNKANATTAGYAIYANTSGQICFGIDDDTTWDPDVASCTSADVYDNTWHHLTAIRNTTADELRIYLDTFSADNDNDTTSATLENTLSLYLGDRDGTNNGDEFNGDIDEVKVFRSALTADQVSLVYNANSATSFGVGSNEKSEISGGAGNLPIGYWNFDENSGSTLYDKTGNGINLTRYGTAKFVPGKIGSAANFDGIEGGDESHFSISTDAYDSYTEGTICGWFKPFDTGDVQQTMVSFAESDSGTHTDFLIVGYDSSSNNFFFEIRDNNVLIMLGGTSTGITANTWNHFCVAVNSSGNLMYLNGAQVVAAYNTGNSSTAAWIDNIAENTTGLSIGCLDSSINSANNCSADTNLYEGQIDEVKIWDYSLTSSQIAYEYNRGEPIGWYKMDECTGTDIYNNARNAHGDAAGNNGTLTLGAGGTTTSGTCSTSGAWFNGATGKLNASLDFDATDDYITLGSPTVYDDLPIISVTAWIYPTGWGEGSFGRIIDKDGANDLSFLLRNGSSESTIEFFRGRATTDAQAVAANNSISLNQWQHVAGVFNQSANTIQLFIDGQEVSYASQQGGSGALDSDAADTLYIGNRAATDRTFDGQIDDLRIYNYQLSQDQIQKIMLGGKTGSAFRFGPEEGSP